MAKVKGKKGQSNKEQRIADKQLQAQEKLRAAKEGIASDPFITASHQAKQANEFYQAKKNAWKDSTYTQEPLMIETADAPVTMEQWKQNKRTARHTAAQEKLNTAAAGIGSDPKVTQNHQTYQYINQRKVENWKNKTYQKEPLMIETTTTREQYDAEQAAIRKERKVSEAREKQETAAKGTGSSKDITNEHIKHQELDPKIKEIIESSDFVEKSLGAEMSGLSNENLDKIKNRQFQTESAIKNYSADTGRTVRKNVATESGGYINGTNTQIGSGSIDGKGGTYLDVKEVDMGFDERLKNLDRRKGTNYRGKLMEKDLMTQGHKTLGANSVEDYRAIKSGIIPKEAAIYKKMQGVKATQEAGETIAKEVVETAAEQTAKKSQGLLKGLSKSKVGRIGAALGVGAMVVSNMNKNKGQQPNSQLYGQQTPYSY